MIRCFLSLVSVAVLSAVAAGQCANGACPVSRPGGVKAGPPSAVAPVRPAVPVAQYHLGGVIRPAHRFAPFGGRFR